MGISIWQLLIILAIVLVLFGAKRLRNIGSDLGSAVKGFKKSMKDTDDDGKDKADEQPRVINAKAEAEAEAKQAEEQSKS